MFGSKKKDTSSPQETHTAEETPLPKGFTPKKGTATPKRKDAQAKGRRPLVADKTKLTKEQRKERKREARAASDAAWRREQEAMRTGDEARMPYQHQGKVRRFGRDFVDASAPISSWFMPTAFLLVPMMFLSSRFPQAAFGMTLAFYAVFFLMFLHAIFVVRRAKKLAGFKFGETAVPRGFTLQMLGRAFYLRRWRLPSAQVKRGEFPEGGRKEDMAALKQARKDAKKARKDSGV